MRSADLIDYINVPSVFRCSAERINPAEADRRRASFSLSLSLSSGWALFAQVVVLDGAVQMQTLSFAVK